jgi:hypothetical protein
MDWQDGVFSVCRRRSKTQTLRKLMDLLRSAKVRQVNQQLVTGRQWQNHLQFPTPGSILYKGFPCFDYPALHMPYPIWSDYAVAIQENYTHYLPPTIMSDKNNHSFITPCDTKRPVDVAHFWTI